MRKISSLAVPEVLTVQMSGELGSDLQRGDRTMRRLTRRDTELVFEQLEALGWVARTPPTRLTDPPHWRVNEHCHQLFENRAKEEAERRHCEQVTLVGVFKKGA